MKNETHQFRLVVIGASTGGLAALRALLGGLPRRFPLPVAVVQHRAVDTAHGLAEALEQASALPVCEPLDKQILEPGRVYLAPADYHALIEADHIALTLEAPVYYARPSIDVLFESAAAALGPAVCAVVLTGATADGAAGAARVAASGGAVLIQDPATAEARVLPEAALAAVPSARVLPLAAIGPALSELARAADLTPARSETLSMNRKDFP